MSYTDWKQCGGTCPKCNAPDIQSRVWKSSDGAHEDINYRCPACKHSWWADGCDS